MTTEHLVTCPHCLQFVLIHELNCGIFPRAIWRETGEQIDPHTSQTYCANIINNALIIGCGKPFEIVVLQDGTWLAQICDFI